MKPEGLKKDKYDDRVTVAGGRGIEALLSNKRVDMRYGAVMGGSKREHEICLEECWSRGQLSVQ